MRTVFAPEGEIRGTDVLAALVALWREGVSGSLQFQRSGATAGFELTAGEIVGASSSDARFDTAAILVRAGKLDAATLERLSSSEGMDRALTALQAGVLTRREWRWGEKIRAVEVLSDLLTWIEGDYTFFRTASRETGEFRLTVPRLVLELFLRSRDRGLVLHYLGGVDVPLVRDSRFDAEFSTFGLTDDAESVVRLIDGESTAAEISSEAPADTFAVEKLLAALVTLGLVHPAYTADEADSARHTPVPAAIPAAVPAEQPEEENEDRPDVDADIADAELDDAELEPEVDIDDKHAPGPVELPAGDADGTDEADELDELGEAGRDEEDTLGRESPSGEAEDLIDAGFDGSPSRDTDEESERLASDFERGRSIPGDLMEPDAPGGREDAFDRPLDLTTGVGSLERPRHRSTSPLLWVLIVLAAIVGGVLFWRARGPGAGEPMVAAPTPSPTFAEETVVGMIETPSAAPALPAVGAPTAARPTLIVPTAGAVRRTPTEAPTRRVPTVTSTRRAALTASPTRPAPTAAPTRRAPSPVATNRPPTPAPAAAAAPALTKAPSATRAAAPVPGRSRKQWLDRAERDRKSAASDRGARFAVQLELACEVPSLTEAWAHDRPAGSMWVVTTPFKGRTCFKVFWGRYATREDAERGLASVPAFFSTARNHPMVVSVR